MDRQESEQGLNKIKNIFRKVKKKMKRKPSGISEVERQTYDSKKDRYIGKKDRHIRVK